MMELFKYFFNNLNERKGKIREKRICALKQLIEADGLDCFGKDSELLLEFFNERELPVELKHIVFNLLFSNAKNLKLFPEFVDFIEKEYSVSKEILFNGKLVEFNFPVFYGPNDTATLCNASLFIFEGNRAIDFFNTVSNKDSLNQLSEMFGKAFIISTDTKFQGDSFMLSTAIALNLEFFPKDFTFTGNLDISKKIFDVESVEQKRKAAQKNNKILIAPEDLKDKDFDYLLKVFSGEYPLIMPFFVEISADKNINPRIFEDVENHFGKEGLIITDDFLQEKAIDKSSLVFNRPPLPEKNEKDMEEWVSVANEVKLRLLEIKSQIEKMFQPNIKSLNIKTVLAIKAPVAFSFILGLSFRNNVETHYIAHFNGKYRFLDFALLQDGDCNLLIECEDNNENKLFVVDLVGNSAQRPYKKLAEKFNLKVCKVEKETDDNIQWDDFLCFAKKLGNFLSENLDANDHLVMILPAVIAFTISFKFIPKQIAKNIYHYSKTAGYLSIPTDNII